MKCPYCQQEMTKKSGEITLDVNIGVWQCDHHAPVIFRQAGLSIGFMGRGSIFVPLKNSWFGIFLGDEHIWIEELVEEEGHPASFILKKQVATKINPNWNITPDNALDKLQTFLVFM